MDGTTSIEFAHGHTAGAGHHAAAAGDEKRWPSILTAAFFLAFNGAVWALLVLAARGFG